jgi:hypothetical protein
MLEPISPATRGKLPCMNEKESGQNELAVAYAGRGLVMRPKLYIGTPLPLSALMQRAS